ncbi:MAG TPA: PQQ-binding-like beta-propeller repeat protein [Ktedonobacteraceae bacterium]|nr:PQQ-binding-like beta-propeller repeat protein [Ktedonobacteraceae bacterium]
MKSEMQTMPCAAWAEKLAALHPNDLTFAEQDELQEHLASCRNCSQVYRDYHYLASLVQDLAALEAPPDLLLGLPELPDGQGEMQVQDAFVSQTKTTSAVLTRLPRRRPWRASRIALVAVVAAVLVAGVLVGSLGIIRQHTLSGVAQGQGPVYYVTPQGGPPASTPQGSQGGLRILASPIPPFFLDGNVYRNRNVYRSDTGAPVRQYFKDLGDVSIYEPRLVDGILYLAVRTDTSQGPGRMVMYALRASNGTVLWKWSDCGESVNMSPPTIINGTVYFICQVAPSLYKLCAFQSETGKLLWLDTLPGEVSLNVLGDQRALYISVDNQILAESTETGALLWKKTFNTNGDFINSAALGNGIFYVTQGSTFFAIRTSDGAQMLEYQFIGDYTTLEPLVDQHVVYLFVREQSRSSIYALDAPTGALYWQKQLAEGGYGSPVVDDGNIYMAATMLATSQQTSFPQSLKRSLLAIRGSDGRTLWQQDIPWNKGKLGYTMIGPPQVSVGDGRIYLVDWVDWVSSQNLQAMMGAFSESNGTLIWTRDIASGNQ